MTVLNKLVLALFLSFAMLAAPSAFAGKVANQTTAETVQALDDTVAAAEAALAAIQNGTDKKETLALIKATKQLAKTIESSVVLSIRDKGMSRTNKARSAYKKDKIEKAAEWMTKAVGIFKKTRTKFHNF